MMILKIRLILTFDTGESSKDQLIAALRWRVENLKRALAEKKVALRQKQREIDRLYEKLAAASPFTDAALRQTLQEVLQRLAALEEQAVEQKGRHL